MNSKLLLLSLFSLLLAFNACKDTDDDEIENTVPRIKKISSYTNNQLMGERTYRYDAAGRILKESFADDYYLEYTWLPGKVVVKATIPEVAGFPVPNPDELTDTLLLNDKGLYMSASPSRTVEYDDEGYLVKQTLSINKVPYSYTYQIENGNTVRWTTRSGSNLENIDSEEICEFLPNSVNTIGDENIGLGFYGKQNKNLVAKVTFINHAANGTAETSETYVYEYDARKRVVKKITVGNPASYIVIAYYD